MPTYEFRCPEGHTFDRFYRKISDAAAEVPCPECGKMAARQLSGGAGLLFQGSGFYLTDYGKNAHRKGESANGAKPSGEGAPAAESKSGETKTESKSETKSETKSDSTTSAKPAASKTSSGSSSTKPEK